MSTASPTSGKFIWHELMTTKDKLAKEFYGALVHWSFEARPIGGVYYSMIRLDGTALGGIIRTNMDDKIPHHWMGQVGVKDVDAMAKKAVALGGSVAVAPREIPGMGRYAAILDPLGSPVALYRDTTGERTGNWPLVAGRIGWTQLVTSKPAKSLIFYCELFGWTNEIFAPGLWMLLGHDGRPVATVASAGEGLQSHWLCFILVNNVELAVARAESLGATAMATDLEAPIVGTAAVLADPTGALFGLMELKGHERRSEPPPPVI